MEPKRTLSRITLPALRLAMALAVAACSEQTPHTAVTGVVRFARDVSLQPDSRAELRLTDVTGIDGAAVQVSAIDINDVSKLPFSYSLPFDGGHINGAHRYTVDVRVFSGSKLLFATDTPFPVLTQGNGRQADIMVIEAGSDSLNLQQAQPVAGQQQIVRGELRIGAELGTWTAGIQENALRWIEEQRGLGKQTFNARYEYNGGYLVRYVDSAPLEIQFNERGKPTAVESNHKSMPLADAQNLINKARNRAAMLRSDVLAVSEAKQHRDATDQAAAPAGIMKLTP